jgi:hypothetical protein
MLAYFSFRKYKYRKIANDRAFEIEFLHRKFRLYFVKIDINAEPIIDGKQANI